MLGWFTHKCIKKRKQSEAEVDAEALMRGFGARAYDEVRRRAREAEDGAVIDGNRDRRHWERVGKIISKRTGRTGLDTATRYLDR